MPEEPERLRLSRMTDREKDEARACPELMDKEARQRQKHEQAADLAGVTLLGQQCRIGNDGQLRHSIYMLGMGWYFLASMSDKLIEMGRNTDSPIIAQALRSRIGPELYQQVIAAHASEKRRGAVAFAFPSSHPPDTVVSSDRERSKAVAGPAENERRSNAESVPLICCKESESLRHPF